MKILLKNLWICKNNLLMSWLFFFCLSLVGKTSHSIFMLFSISGAYALGVTLFAILIINFGYYRKN